MSFSQLVYKNIFTGEKFDDLFNNINGDLIPSTDITYDIGSSSKRWDVGYINQCIGLNSSFQNGRFDFINSLTPNAGIFIQDFLDLGNRNINNVGNTTIGNILVNNSVRLNNIPLRTTETNQLHYDPVSKIVSYGVSGGGTTEAGISYVNTTATNILSIPTTATIIPIFYAVSPTITHTINWSNQWALGTGTQNRFIYSGSNRRFYMEVDICLGTGASSATVYMALYKNGSALANSGVGQTQQVFGALIPTLEKMSFTFPFTATTNDFFELYIYGSSTGLNIQPVSASSFSPSTLCPCLSIEIKQVNI